MSDIHQLVDFPGTVGAIEIGLLFSTGLAGTLLVQMYVYYTSFPNDALWIKLYVAVLGILELSHLVVVGHDLYAVTVTGWGNPQSLMRLVGISAAPIPGAVVSLMVHFFFARRIWIMGLPKGAILCYMLISIQFVANFATGCIALTYNVSTQFIVDYEWLLTTYISLGATIDALIPIFLCYLLWPARDIGVKRTTSLVDKIMVWTIQTGLVTGYVKFVIPLEAVFNPGKTLEWRPFQLSFSYDFSFISTCSSFPNCQYDADANQY
ncbi:hypothetical protein HGRIS_006631 [Hohenbuehelia grisea]|uniref:DUF6534 domain-containing protein n=1 Tax=Hohenbuehelia grisea TaxID=104357 RepID=A0ABR3J9I5_9AGAR